MIDQIVAVKQPQQRDLLDRTRDRTDNNTGTRRRVDLASRDRPLKDLGHGGDRRFHVAPKSVLEQRRSESKFSSDGWKATEKIRSQREIDVLGDHRAKITSKITEIGGLKSNDVIKQCIPYQFGLR